MKTKIIKTEQEPTANTAKPPPPPFYENGGGGGCWKGVSEALL